MAASSDDSDEETFVVIGTPLPPIEEGDPIKKPTTVQDLTAKDKQGRRRFHGAFTGGFSAGYFNSVGSKEGFTPSTFVSSRSQKRDDQAFSKPEDFMDDEDLTEHGIAPRKFSTQGEFTSEERKRKFQDDVKKISGSSIVDIGAALSDLIVPENITIGIKLLRKMGWKEGQGLGPRIRKRKKKKDKKTLSGANQAKVYGCALPASSDSNSDDSDVPASLQDVTFAPRDKTPISMTPKEDTHGLGYRGIDPSLALPSSHVVRHSVPVSKSKHSKGIRGQAFGVGAFEDEDEDIYAQDNMSNYDLTMTEGDDGPENLFGWTAPRSHGKQTVPISYVGKMLEGFCLSSKPLVPHKKYLPPALPKNFKPIHWFRRKNIEDAAKGPEKLTAVDRGLLLGETPVMGSVFDLISGPDKARISSTKEAIAISQSLATQPSPINSKSSPKEDDKKETPSPSKETTDGSKSKEKFLSKFTPASVENSSQSQSAPLFQGSVGFQPFRKDQAKQSRYDKYLSLVKQGIRDPYTQLSDNPLTEWEKSRERDEFSMASRLYKPMSAMMSARFVQAAVMDDSKEQSLQDEQTEQSDHVKAAEMKMFGKLTREEFEWHPDKLVCKRFNVPNPYPGSDIVGLTTVKRDKYSIFNFLSFGDYQPSDRQEPSQAEERKPEEVSAKTKELKPTTPAQRKAKMASIFSVLDDPDFNKPSIQAETSSQKDIGPGDVAEEEKAESAKEDNAEEPDVDLFRAIFKNSDSEDSEDSSEEEDKESVEDIAGEVKEEETQSALNEGSFERHLQDNMSRNVELDLNPSFPDVRASKASVEQMTNPFASVFKDSKNSSRKSSQNQKSVFSVLGELSDNENEKDMDVQNSEETSETFGPCLPPPLDISSSTDSSFIHRVPHSHEKEKKKRKEDSDRWRERSLEQVKDKSKLKKAKRKKSKLRKKDKKHKKHKRKSSKHKSKRSQTESSGSEADTDSSDEHRKHKRKSSKHKSRRPQTESSGSEAETDSSDGD